MKTTLMTIALAFATLPLTFAAQTPATPASGNPAPATTTKVKKHTKKHSTKPAVKNSASTSSAPAAASSAPAATPAKK